MTLQRDQTSPGLNVPQLDLTVPAGGRQPEPVGAETQSKQVAAVTLQSGNAPAGSHVP